MGIIFWRSHCSKARAYVHECGNYGTHARKIVHIIHQYHKTPPCKHHEYVYNKITDGKIYYWRFNRTLVEPDWYDSHGLQKNFLYWRIHIFTYNDIMDDLDAAGSWSGAGPNKAHRKQKHLRGLRPFFIVGSGEPGCGQERHYLECRVPDRIH